LLGQAMFLVFGVFSSRNCRLHFRLHRIWLVRLRPLGSRPLLCSAHSTE
jgi:hypothetical protein